MSVLNDDWASHPTWASEDSGFVAHRKNIYEESLHRIEEERHDYDFNIEANAKVIQLLEPIGQSVLSMTPEERENFRMPIGLGGQSQAIYKRVLKKVYGERGPEVVADLFRDPCAVLPIVLARLKQKDEEWRFTQREWEKVWHAQTQAMYWKSLDHMGIQVKSSDKKNLAAKHLVEAIRTKRTEQKNQRKATGKAPKYQYAFEFPDQEVILDLLHFMVLYATNASQHNFPERRRIAEFFEKFVTTFFGLSEDAVRERLDKIHRGSSEDDSEDVGLSELPPSRGRPRPVKRSLLKEAAAGAHAARNGTKVRGQNQDSAGGSKESTPDVDSFAEDDAVDAAEDQAVPQVTNERWTTVPIAFGTSEADGATAQSTEHRGDQQFKRSWYRLYGNQTIFVFFSIFQTLYRRLSELKEAEDDAKAEGKRSTEEKPARVIGLIHDKDDFYIPAPGETYYSQTLILIKEFVNGDVEEATYQSWLRRYYLKKGWQLYTISDLLKSLCRLGSVCSSVDSKEKTPDLMEQFYRNRQSVETSYNIEITMRKQAEKYIKDAEMFLIQWVCADLVSVLECQLTLFNSFRRQILQLCNGLREMRPPLTLMTCSVWNVGSTMCLLTCGSRGQRVLSSTKDFRSLFCIEISQPKTSNPRMATANPSR
jgi:paired amphipathic helix protein Sin3a